MDDRRIARLSRLVAARTTRRTSLALLTALGLLGLSQRPTTAARPCKRRKWCGVCKHCQLTKLKKPRCVPNPLGSACPGGSCRFGECICREAYRSCPERRGCIPNDECCTADDCPAAQICQFNGTCTCPAGTIPCADRCCIHQG